MHGYTTPPFTDQNVHRIRILDIQRNEKKINKKYEQERVQFKISNHFRYIILLMFLYTSFDILSNPIDRKKTWYQDCDIYKKKFDCS